MLLHKARLITFPLPRWLRHGAIQILLIVALLWAFFYLTGDILVEGLDNISSKTDPNDSAKANKGKGTEDVKPSDDANDTTTKDASKIVPAEEKEQEKVVVPQFQGSPTDGNNTANTASQQSNSNSAQATENSKNDHYVYEK